MRITTLTYAGKEYQARLDINGCLELERKLGENPLNILTVLKNEKLPKIADLITILHQSLLPLQHGIKYDDVINMWAEDGADLNKLLTDIVNIFRDSGLVREETN